MKRIKDCTFYYILWCLYNLQGILYASGTAISQGLLAILVVWSFYIIFSNWGRLARVPYFKALGVLVAMYTIYGILSVVVHGAMVHNVPATEYFKRSYISMLPIFVSYIYTVTGKLNFETMQKWMFVFFFIGLAFFYRSKFEALDITDGDETTNNASYVIMSLIPGLLVFYKKPVYLYVGLAVCVVLVVLGMKRGAIIITAVALWMIINQLFRIMKGKYRSMLSIAVLVGIIMLANFVGNLLETSAYFNQRIQQTIDGDSSQRDIIYNSLWRVFTEQSNVFEQLFGHGAWGTRELAHAEAHQDWLQILIDNGLLGIVFFINYWIKYFKETRNIYRHNLSRLGLKLFFLMYFAKTFFSMSICSVTIFASTFIGFYLADGFASEENDYENKSVGA